ncbi:hypothetical protein, partial [Pseudomonas syringae]|uniref:hypothetical protein n=1 Tax=Pseudomonas syringae TaxID=317 RepID=UPI0019552BB2
TSYWLAENSNFIKNLGCRSWVSYFENSTLVPNLRMSAKFSALRISQDFGKLEDLETIFV